MVSTYGERGQEVSINLFIGVLTVPWMQIDFFKTDREMKNIKNI